MLDIARPDLSGPRHKNIKPMAEAHAIFFFNFNPSDWITTMRPITSGFIALCSWHVRCPSMPREAWA
ncbi:MAG: hypothetical protein WCA63_06830 [Gallionella sp.]